MAEQMNGDESSIIDSVWINPSSGASNDAEEDEDECRVCRGPSEEGRPLFKPCKCSGSIGLTHQDCLQSWLEVQRGNGSCELCKTPFRFSPHYAEHAPDRLPVFQVVLGLSRRFLARWLPFVLRLLFAASLWLLVAPLVTAYLYHGWMDRPSAIMERFQWTLLTTDLVSGAVVAAYIIISFLSLMSFADFLRVEWLQRGWGQAQRGGNVGGGRVDPNHPHQQQQQRHQQQQQPQQPLQQQHMPQRRRQLHNQNLHHHGGMVVNGGGLNPPAPREEDIDNAIWLDLQQDIVARHNAAREGAVGGEGRRPAGPAVGDVDEVDYIVWKRARRQDRHHDQHRNRHHPHRDTNNNNNNNNSTDCEHDDDDNKDKEHEARIGSVGDDDDDGESDDGSWSVGSSSHDDDDDDDDELIQDDVADDDHQEGDDDMPELEPLVPDIGQERQEPLNDGEGNPPPEQQQAQRNDVRLDRPFDFEQDDPVDVDINIALDELLGVRGPLISVIRNLLWLLAFNAVYVGCFCFVPRTVGTAVSSLVFNTTGFREEQHGGNVTLLMTHNLTGRVSIFNILRGVELESQRHKTAFRLNDLATVTLGYLVFAAGVVLCRFLWTMSEKIGFFRAAGRRTGHPDADDMREVFDEMNRIVHGQANDVPQLDEPPGVALSLAIGIALDALMAIVKVGVLLLLKMFMLPIVLGICLDASVMSLFGGSLEERVAYAGRDLFAFVLLHWVFGITFMLLVTVSVLQLREVAHPDLLAQMIRPQEPQPDLLGNLMHESLGTHAKRMILSLVIYAALLGMHVYLPVRFVTSRGIDKYFPFFDLKFFYVITPRLQVPLELLFFHLCMLALLEKYKNCIGDMQHRWLKFLTGLLDLMDCVLPRSIEGFRYVGSRRVFEEQHVLDSFWSLLVEGKQDREELLASQLDTFQPVPCSSPFVIGVTKSDGHRVLGFGSDYIRLPVRLPGRTFRSRSILLPSTIGRYRLKHEHVDLSDGQCGHMIHLMEEVPGTPIPRPPEGWDDLGVEPPDVQGRWAWGSEKKSAIEGGVARRKPYFRRGQSWASFLVVCIKLSAMLLLSWAATTMLVCFVLAAPLAVGRLMYFIFRVPSKWIHDPIAFGLGMMVLYPVARTVGRAAVAGDAPLWRRLLIWVSRFHLPTFHKMAVLCYSTILWFGLAPLFLGAVYDMFFVRSRDFFLGKEALADSRTLLMCWATGTALLYVWSDLCIAGVLTRRFRVFVLEGRDVADDNMQGHIAPPAAGVAAAADAWHEFSHGRQLRTWQGEHGRMARFWATLRAVVYGWEWDKVDEDVLLWDCAWPVTVELFWAMLIPVASMVFCFWRFPFVSGLHRAIIVRFIIATVVSAQVSLVWRDQLMDWFEAAHKTARDDLYLIGEVLLNYGEE